MEAVPDKKQLIALAHYKMPFGKYKGEYLLDLPQPYLLWFKEKGFPEGKLGKLMRAALEMKINGLESLFQKIREEFPSDSP